MQHEKVSVNEELYEKQPIIDDRGNLKKNRDPKITKESEIFEQTEHILWDISVKSEL